MHQYRIYRKLHSIREVISMFSRINLDRLRRVAQIGRKHKKQRNKEEKAKREATAEEVTQKAEEVARSTADRIIEGISTALESNAQQGGDGIWVLTSEDPSYLAAGELKKVL